MKNNLRRYRNRSSPAGTPINVTVNVQVNGFRLTDIAMQAEIEKHRKAETNNSSGENSQEDVIVVRELKDLSENSETSQNATNV